MAFPVTMFAVLSKLPEDVQLLAMRDYGNREKSTGTAYLAWFFLGFHYLYLKQWAAQIAFWLTLGGLGMWWFLDVFRVAGLVNRKNEEIAMEVMVQYKLISS